MAHVFYIVKDLYRMDKKRYVIKRLALSVPVLFFITIVAFFTIRLIPGDPAAAILGDKATPSAIAAFRTKYGLDQNIFVQYIDYLKAIMHLDFGISLKYRIPVSEIIGGRFFVTILLTCLSMIFTMLISFSISYKSAMHKGERFDHAVQIITQIGLSIPAFFIGMLLLLIFGVQLHWFPTSGWGFTAGQHLQSLVLPAFTQAIAITAIVTRNLRGSIIEIRNSDYVQFAESQGLDEKTIKNNYIIRNAIIPTITILSMQFVSLVGGSVVIESVFTLPGLGSLLVDSIFARDYAVVQTAILLYGVFALLIFLITDIVYMFVDPRIKLD